MIILCVVIFYRLLPDIEDYQENYYQVEDYQFDDSFYWINVFAILPISSLVFLAYMIYLCVIGFKRHCKRRTQYRLVNVQSEDSHDEDSDSGS